MKVPNHLQLSRRGHLLSSQLMNPGLVHFAGELRRTGGGGAYESLRVTGVPGTYRRPYYELQASLVLLLNRKVEKPSLLKTSAGQYPVITSELAVCSYVDTTKSRFTSVTMTSRTRGTHPLAVYSYFDIPSRLYTSVNFGRRAGGSDLSHVDPRPYHLRAYSLFMVYVSGVGVWGLDFFLWFGVKGVRFRVQGLGFRVGGSVLGGWGFEFQI